MDGTHAQAIRARLVTGRMGGRFLRANPFVRQLTGRDAGGWVKDTARLIISVDHRRRVRDHLYGAIHDHAQRGLCAGQVTRPRLVDRRADMIELLERVEKIGNGLIRRDSGRNGYWMLHAHSIADRTQRAVAFIPAQIVRGRASLQKPGLSRV
jgi:hypothetical protein